MPAFIPQAKHVLWDESEIASAVSGGAPLSCIYSGQFNRMRSGDTVWIVGKLNGRFVTIGFVRVAKKQPGKEGNIELIASDPVRPKIIDLTDDWKDSLRFENQTSEIESGSNGLPNVHRLRAMRELTIRSKKWLERRWRESA